MFTRFGVDMDAEGIDAEKLNRQELGDAIFDKLKERYDAKEQLIGADAMRHHERIIMLSVLDQQWKDHLLSMDHLREGIGLRGYGQHDPLVEYKRESFDMFEAMMERFEEETVRYLYLMQVIERAKMAAGIAAAGRWTAAPTVAASLEGRVCESRETVAAMGDASTACHDLDGRHGSGVPASQAPRTRPGAHGRRRRSKSRCSRSSAATTRSDGTILARAAAARNTRSATAHKRFAELSCVPSQVRRDILFGGILAVANEVLDGGMSTLWCRVGGASAVLPAVRRSAVATETRHLRSKPLSRWRRRQPSACRKPIPSDEQSSQGLPIPENIAAVISYVTIIPAIVFVFLEPFRRNLFVRFHAFQHLFLFGVGIASAVAAFLLSMLLQLIPFMRVLVFPFAGLIGLAWFFLWLLLVTKAYHHEMFKLPWIGDLAEKYMNR